jgi:hypothetical protein
LYILNFIVGFYFDGNNQWNTETSFLIWCMKEDDRPVSKIDTMIQLCVYSYKHCNSVNRWIMSDVLNATADRGVRAI